MDNLTVAGLGLFILATALRELFGWLKQKNLQNSESRLKSVEESAKSTNEQIDLIKKKIYDLHEWHDKTDQDGVKIWYVRKSLEDTLADSAKAMNILAENSELQTRLLEEIIQEQRSFRTEQLTFTKLIGTLLSEKNKDS